MARKNVLFIKIKVREVFPPGDPVVPYFLRLMAAVNELRTLGTLWLQAVSRQLTTQSEKEIGKAEDLYLFRLTCGTLYEAGKAFLAFQSALVQAGQDGLIAKMAKEGRDAYSALDNVFKKDRKAFETTDFGKTLVSLRNNVAFHYPEDPDLFREALQEHEELADIVAGDIVGVSRYLVADALQTIVFKRMLGKEWEDKLRALSQTVGHLSLSFGQLVDEWASLQLAIHEDAVASTDEDTLTEESLWRIDFSKHREFRG